MAQTPVGTAAPYLTAAELWAFVAPEVVGDSLRADADGPRPSRRALQDITRGPGLALYDLLLAASGEVNAAALAGKRYQVADLLALTGADRRHLLRVTAGLAAFLAASRLKPGTADPKLIPGVQFAWDELKRLRDGEHVFGFLETQEAGLPRVSDPDLNQTSGPAATTAAGRFFGRTNPRGN